MDACAQFGDSRSDGFRDIRGVDFVWNERTNEKDEAYANSSKRLKTFRLKIKQGFTGALVVVALSKSPIIIIHV